ncbi:hypothetical protein PV325_010951 [Microctonus aethiopoides]|nr:hypothetical protein PV325_010951 [Microctonus aethiopoides]
MLCTGGDEDEEEKNDDDDDDSDKIITNQAITIMTFLAVQQYDEMKQKFNVLFTNAKLSPATQKIHKVTPLSNYTVEVKPYSDAEKYSIHSTIKKIKKQSLRVEK